MPLSVKLVVVGGEVKTAEIKLRLPSTIGRGRGATIMLPHPLVSRTHCELFESEGRLMVRDLGSLNGTFINNQRVTEAPLPAGELLTVGTVTFRAVYETDEEPAGPPSGPAPVLKSRPHDTELSATLRANQPPASASSKTPVAPMEVDFNFAQPLVDFDEEPAPAPAPPKKPQATQETSRGEATVEEVPAFEVAEEVPTTKPGVKPPAKPDTPPAKPAAKPAGAAPSPASKPVPAAPATSAPAAPAKDAKTVSDSKWKEDDEAPVESATEDDDDFNDFLKSLGSK
jgi:hypothetical protein